MYSRREVQDMEYRYYSELKDGIRKVKISETVYRCPFCYRDRKRDYGFQDLLRHAYNNSRSSYVKDGRENARHGALERYMKKYLSPSVKLEPVEAVEWKGVETSSVVKAEPMSEDDYGQRDKERSKLSLKGIDDKAYPSKRVCLDAGVKEEQDESNQQIVRFAPSYPQRNDSLAVVCVKEEREESVAMFAPSFPHRNDSLAVACVKQEREESLQQISRFAPKYPQRNDSLVAASADSQFVYPWKGILANMERTYNQTQRRYVGESGTKMKQVLTSKGFNPHKVEPLWNHRGFTGFAIVHFGKEWDAFKNVTMFEKHFEVNQCGKRDFDATHPRDQEDKLYGWVAKREDYYSRTAVGDYLKKKKGGDLVSVSGKEDEFRRKTSTLVSDLKSTLETKSIDLQQMETHFSETCSAVEKKMREKDEMINKHNEKMSCIQQTARNYLAEIYKVHEDASQRLEAEKKSLEEREESLDKCQAENKTERRKLQWDKMKNKLATDEQKKADKDMSELVEQQQKEKDDLRRKVFKLQKQVDAGQALELEIERMKGDLQVMGHMQEGGDPEIKEQIEKTKEELKAKEEEFEFQRSIYTALTVKHIYTNDELQDARKALIHSMQELRIRAPVGVKRMGELDLKPFQKHAKEKYPAEEAEEKAAEICSLWDDHLRDSGWHPIRVVVGEGGNAKEVLNEEDEKLQALRKEFGEEVFKAVTVALQERNEYNGSGRYIVPVFWNYEQGRIATLKEGVAYLLNLWKQKKPKPKRR